MTVSRLTWVYFDEQNNALAQCEYTSDRRVTETNGALAALEERLRLRDAKGQ